MTQQGYQVSTRQFRALFLFVPLCTLICLFCLGCAHKPQPVIPVTTPVEKLVKKNSFGKWKVDPGEPEVWRGQTITWKAVGAKVTILNPHPELFEGGATVLEIPKDAEGSLTVSTSAVRGKKYVYAIFVYDGDGEFAKGSDPKIIVR